MRGFLLVFLVLLLLIDLAEDGFPGEARFVCPLSPLSGSVATCSQYTLEQADSWCEPSVPDSPEIFTHYQNQTVTVNFLNNFKKIIFCHHNSTGGIPL